MSQYTLSIADEFDFTVRFAIDKKVFGFSIHAKRTPQSVIEVWLADKDRQVKDLMKDVMLDWTGQTLVLAGDKPADFSAEALEAMLDAPGVAGKLFGPYLIGNAAKEKN